MDKLLNNTWFVRLISFLVALMLYTVVALPENQASNPIADRDDNVTGNADIIEDVELVAYYDEEKYIISGLPETVNVHIDGSTTQVFMTKMQKDFEVYVNLEELGTGTHNVRVNHRGFDEELTVTIQPQTVRVTIDEKKSENFPVEIDFLNEDSLPEGHSVEEAVITPSTVTVIGSEQKLGEIAFVRGFIDLKDTKETISTSVPVNVYDFNGNEIAGLSIEPAVVDVEVPIVGPNKAVPFKINQEGQLPDGLSVESIQVNPETVTVYGSEAAISEVEFLELTVDLTEITEKTTITLDVPLPNGIKMTQPEQVELIVDVGPQEEKKLENVPLQVNGIGEGYHISYVNPTNGMIDVIVKGTASRLENITTSDISAYVDVSGLDEGEHTLSVTFNGPQNISWEERQVTVLLERK